jgi:hypothetical protein
VVVILAAGGGLHWAATPLEAVLPNVECTAAGAGFGARMSVSCHMRWVASITGGGGIGDPEGGLVPS